MHATTALLGGTEMLQLQRHSMLAATLPVALESTVPLQEHTMNQTPAQTVHLGCLEMERVQVLAMLVPMANIKMRRGKRIVCNAQLGRTETHYKQKRKQKVAVNVRLACTKTM